MSISIDSPENLVILGGSGFAREVVWLVSDINQVKLKKWNLVGFWERRAELTGQLINGVPVIGSDDVRQYLPDLFAVAAIGDPRVKERAVKEAENVGCQFATLIHPTVQYDQSTVTIGPGSIICAGNILTVNITIGTHVIINLDCTIGHDCVIEDYATISPGCHLSGYTVVRKGAYLGTGAVTVEKHEIGVHSIIGAGSVIVKDIPANVTALGIPAKVLGK
jgi:sugar O-acyltransferase (sialic acid O-acetyltransferase NeuD family)